MLETIYLNQRLSDQCRTGYSTIQASALNHFDDHFHSIMFSTQEPLELSVLARAEQTDEWLYSVRIVQFDFTRSIRTIAKFVFQSLNVERIALAIGQPSRNEETRGDRRRGWTRCFFVLNLSKN